MTQEPMPTCETEDDFLFLNLTRLWLFFQEKARFFVIQTSPWVVGEDVAFATRCRLQVNSSNLDIVCEIDFCVTCWF